MKFKIEEITPAKAFMLVCRDVPNEVFTRLDSGRRRTPADALSAAGIENHRRCSAAVTIILFAEYGSHPTAVAVTEWCRRHEEQLALMCESPKLPSMPGTISDAVFLITGKRPKEVNATFGYSRRISEFKRLCKELGE